MPDGAAETIHASAVVIGETGILIRGASGAGKSALASQLIFDARPRGLFARLVGDDRIILSAAGGRLIARPHPKIRGKIEQRWDGIIETQHEPASVLHCQVELSATAPEQLPRLPAEDQEWLIWRGLTLPGLVLPAALGSAAQSRRVLEYIARINPAEFT